MAGAPHVRKQCGICKRELTPQSFTGTISFREKGFIIKKAACLQCMNDHYSKGE